MFFAKIKDNPINFGLVASPLTLLRNLTYCSVFYFVLKRPRKAHKKRHFRSEKDNFHLFKKIKDLHVETRQRKISLFFLKTLVKMTLPVSARDMCFLAHNLKVLKPTFKKYGIFNTVLKLGKAINLTRDHKLSYEDKMIPSNVPGTIRSRLYISAYI